MRRFPVLSSAAIAVSAAFFRAHVSALTGKLVEIKHPHEAPPKN
jgi:hypothetical protein